MTRHIADIDRILAAAGSIIVNDGYSAVSLDRIAHHADVPTPTITELFDSVDHILISMLNREYALMYASIVDHIERDPRGGLLSRMYMYILSAIYERPLAKTLFVIDRDALNSIMRNAHGFAYVPSVGIRSELIERLQEVGMVRRDTDASMVSSVLSVTSAGMALTAPHDDLDLIIRGVCDLLSRGVDAQVDDTEPGKSVFYEWATSLTLPQRD